jgi:heme-degrading monooxygenase HmoA
MPFALMARYTVRDLDTFLRSFDSFEPLRQRYGEIGHRLLRPVGDSQEVLVIIEFDSREAAERFAQSGERLDALRQAGVIERVDEICDVVRMGLAPGGT